MLCLSVSHSPDQANMYRSISLPPSFTRELSGRHGTESGLFDSPPTPLFPIPHQGNHQGSSSTDKSSPLSPSLSNSHLSSQMCFSAQPHIRTCRWHLLVLLCDHPCISLSLARHNCARSPPSEPRRLVVVMVTIASQNVYTFGPLSFLSLHVRVVNTPQAATLPH